jgi:predicted metal-binding protein
LNNKLLDIESKLPNARVLFSGNCHFCENCSRKDGTPCVEPNKMRYSLESLGYKVSDICENILNEKLQWEKGTRPSYLFLVSAILTNDAIDPKIIEGKIGSGL